MANYLHILPKRGISRGFLYVKPSGRDVFYHTYNRVAGDPGDRPFAEVELVCYKRLRGLTLLPSGAS